MDFSPWTQADRLERYRGYLLVLARLNHRRLLRGKVDPSDLVQTALLHAYDKRLQFRGQSEPEFLAWLRTILANHLAGAVRRISSRGRDATLERSIDQALADSDSRVTTWLAALDPSPSQLIARAERVIELANALADLPPDQRQAIELHHLQKRSLAETAGEMGRSREAVAGLLYRALQRLRRYLEPVEEV